jgi:uncharacterized protein (TIGR04255 family)
MSGYLPFAGRNAIAEMSIGIQFALPFDQKVGEAIDAIKTVFAADLPKFDPLQMITINIANIGAAPLGAPQLPIANPAPAVTGFNLSKVKADGSMARALRAMGNLLSAHFSEYTSWAEIKPQAIGYIRRCLEKLTILDRNQVTGVLLRYIDRFTFDGATQDANAGRLFQPDNKFVALKILDRGYQWHSNSGWFEQVVGAASALNQLNVSSGPLGVIIDHNSACNLPLPYKSIAELMEGRSDHPSLETILDRQHKANADLLRNLLNQQMLDTIGLKG